MNNPINFIDPKGLTIDEGRELLSRIGQRLMDEGRSPEEIIKMLRGLSYSNSIGEPPPAGMGLGALGASAGLAGVAGVVGFIAGTLLNEGITTVIGEPLGSWLYDKTHKEACNGK